MKKIIKSFFYSGDDFKPPYFWATFISLGMIVATAVTIATKKNLTTLVLGLFGGWGVVMAMYNLGKKK